MMSRHSDRPWSPRPGEDSPHGYIFMIQPPPRKTRLILESI